MPKMSSWELREAGLRCEWCGAGVPKCVSSCVTRKKLKKKKNKEAACV